jgi:hypothetical protein
VPAAFARGNKKSTGAVAESLSRNADRLAPPDSDSDESPADRFELVVQGDEVKVVDEKHYRLVTSSDISRSDLDQMAGMSD